MYVRESHERQYDYNLQFISAMSLLQQNYILDRSGKQSTYNTIELFSFHLVSVENLNDFLFDVLFQEECFPKASVLGWRPLKSQSSRKAN